MTIPSERTRAVQAAREFFEDLLHPSRTPRVPKSIRNRAYRCLRHYPANFHLTRAAELAPESWGKPE